MLVRIRPGDELPNATLAQLVGDSVAQFRMHDLAGRKNIVFFGLVGAHVPACARHHVPNILECADKLLAHGIDEIFVLSPNDPWVTADFAGGYAAHPRVRFMSDGNLEFGIRSGLSFEGTESFLGRRSHRFLIVARNLIVQRIAVEDDPTAVTCTRAEMATG